MSTVATGAKEQVARLLALVPYLHARGDVQLDEAAAALGLPERQVVKDLRVLFMCGLPGGYPDDLIDVDIEALTDPDGDRVIRVTNADYLARPLRLTPTEATALIVALRALRAGADSEQTRDVVDRALAKLEQAAAATPAEVIDPGAAPDVALVGLRARLQEAVAAGQQVRLVYYVPSRDEESERVVDPHGITGQGATSYLDAWCHLAEAPRWFRLDRIRAVEVLDSPVETRAEPRDLAEGLFAQRDELAVVTLDVAPEAYWITEYYPVQAVRSAPQRGEGHHEVDVVVADEHWLMALLLRVAPHARVIAPGPYASSFLTRARAVLGLYE